MSKTYLVARREYLENLRTKTFWIGIAAFPAILVLAIAVPMWLEKKKDVRKYAVIDQSGWLLAAVDERADGPDLEKVFRRWLKDFREGKLKLDALPQLVRVQVDEIVRTIDDEQIEAAARVFASLAGPDAATDSLPEPMLRRIRQAYDAVRTWWKGLPPAEAAELAAGISRSRYQRRELDPGWTDPQAELAKLLSRGEVFAYFVIGSDPVKSSDGCKYVSNNLTDDSLKDWFGSLATDAVRSRRLKEKQIDEVTAAWIRDRLEFEGKKVDDKGEETEVKAADTLSQFGPVVFVYVLWIAIFTIAQLLLTNTIEEKSSRVIEVLLSSVSPEQLMRGKILGIAATGLTIVGSWVVFFLIAIKSLPLFISMPNVDLMALVRNPAYLVSFIGYFLLGYLFYAALFVAMGSVCNSLKEAQNLMLPIMILLMVPLFAMMPVGKDPNGSLARLLSYVPPFTPFIMMNRAAGPPSVTDYVATTVILLVAVAAVFWSAGRVFRVGILMTGKPPRLKDIARLALGR